MGDRDAECHERERAEKGHTPKLLQPDQYRALEGQLTEHKETGSSLIWEGEGETEVRQCGVEASDPTG